MSTQTAEVGEKLAQLVEQTGTDADFRAEFLANPRDVYAAEGIDIPAEVEIVVVEPRADVAVLPLPPYTGDRLSSDELEAVTGGLGLIAGAVAIAGIGTVGGLGALAIAGTTYVASKAINAMRGQGK